MAGETRVAWGLVVAAVGVVGYHRLADALATFDESVDAVGSERGFEGAEAAGWKRALYRAGFALVAVGGVVLALWGVALLVA